MFKSELYFPVELSNKVAGLDPRVIANLSATVSFAETLVQAHVRLTLDMYFSIDITISPTDSVYYNATVTYMRAGSVISSSTQVVNSRIDYWYNYCKDRIEFILNESISVPNTFVIDKYDIETIVSLVHATTKQLVELGEKSCN